jgi:hypothetical protein
MQWLWVDDHVTVIHDILASEVVDLAVGRDG